MARYDVHRALGGAMMLDCQADILRHLNTRFVVPLLPPDTAPRAAERLNPEFIVMGERLVMYTQFAGAIPKTELGDEVASLADRHDVIMNAIDMLVTGY